MSTDNTIALQAAVVTMLLAKRPQLATLPIDWTLKTNGSIYVDLAICAPTSCVPAIASELAKAMRGAALEVSGPLRFRDGRPYRSYQVRGKHAGVRVDFDGLEHLDGGDES
ncbi:MULTISPECIES: hypothetical protein [unclassified Streptomyces]|uniref:hypothetical protein n=1 Tax=unclassified Streptomyces TaxID=2593676 RepID=UPI00382DB02B